MRSNIKRGISKTLRNPSARDRRAKGPLSANTKDLREQLVALARTLHAAMIMSITCEHALNHMNGEEDRDVATILRIHSSGKMCSVLGYSYQSPRNTRSRGL